MALPTIVGLSGIFTNNGGGLGMPGGIQAGDIGILHSTTRGTVLGTPTGYTLLFADTPGTDPRCYTWYRVLDGTETTFPNPGAGSSRIHRGIVIRGADPTAPIHEGAAVTSAGGNPKGHPAVTTSGSDRLVLAFMSCIDDGAVPSAYSGATGGTWVSRSDVGNSSASDCRAVIQSAEMPTAGTISGGSVNEGNSNVWITRAFALRPSAAVVDHALSGSAAGTSQADADLVVARTLAGQVPGVSTAGGSLAVARPLSGSASGNGDLEASLSVHRPLAGLAAGSSEAIASLSFLVPMSGAASGSSEATAVLHVDRGLSGAALGASDSLGSLSVVRALGGLAAGDAAVVAQLAVARALAGSVDGISDAEAGLRVARALAGLADGASEASGTLRLVISLGGAADGASDAVAMLRRAIALAGLAEGEATATATLGFVGEGPLELPVIVVEVSGGSTLAVARSGTTAEVGSMAGLSIGSSQTGIEVNS